MKTAWIKSFENEQVKVKVKLKRFSLTISWIFLNQTINTITKDSRAYKILPAIIKIASLYCLSFLIYIFTSMSTPTPIVTSLGYYILTDSNPVSGFE